VITLDLRAAIARATAGAGLGPVAADPMLRPAGGPGRYATSLPFTLNKTDPGPVARALATGLATEAWIASAEVTGRGYVTVTITPQALAGVAARIAAAGPDCARSDVLRGAIVGRVPPADLAAAASWEEARAAVAAEVAGRLAVAAGATVAGGPTGPVAPGGGVAVAGEAAGPAAGGAPGRRQERDGEVAAAVAFAGADAVRLALASVIPGRPARVDPARVARRSPDNPAYAVRYAHARAVSVARWAAALGSAAGATAPPAPAGPAAAAARRLPADPADLALLDALSWLPERVACAARRRRPDEFARYLGDLAGAAIAAARFVGPRDNAKLAVARDVAVAAQAGLAAGLGLAGASAPARL
jgi:arginyl-tRNA synthetase